MTAPNPRSLSAWFAGRTAGELLAVEQHNGLHLFPEALRRRGTDGLEAREDVLVCVPTKAICAEARLDAIIHVQRMARDRKLKLTVETMEQAQSVVGVALFDDFDTYAIVSRCTFEPKLGKDGPQRFALMDLLLANYPQPSIFDLFDRLQFYLDLVDPRVPELSEEEFWASIAAVARCRNISPLSVMRGALQAGLVVRAATELVQLRLAATSSSSSPSTETSTQDS